MCHPDKPCVYIVSGKVNFRVELVRSGKCSNTNQAPKSFGSCTYYFTFKSIYTYCLHIH